VGQILHGGARATETVRRAIQHSEESLRSPAKRYGINRKTVAKWRRRTAVKDLLIHTDAEVEVIDEAAATIAREIARLPATTVEALIAKMFVAPHLKRGATNEAPLTIVVDDPADAPHAVDAALDTLGEGAMWETITARWKESAPCRPAPNKRRSRRLSRGRGKLRRSAARTWKSPKRRYLSGL